MELYDCSPSVMLFQIMFIYYLTVSKYDVIFKRIFIDDGLNDCLPEFLSSFTGIPTDDMGEITVTNSELIPDEFDGKVSRLDLKVKMKDRQVNVEIQLLKRAGYVERALFYSAKMVSGSLKKGQAYINLPSAISLNVVDYKLFTDEERKDRVHTAYRLRDTQTGPELTDNLELHFIELPKFDLSAAIDKNDKQSL